MYDVTDRETFDNVRTWINEIEKYSTQGVCKILVGNKCDKEAQRQVSKEEGQEFAQQFNMPFLETSAKATLNVEEAFLKMTSEIYNDKVLSGKENLRSNAATPGGPNNGAPNFGKGKAVPQQNM